MKLKKEVKLKKALGLFEATAYGVGIILGAGIYALIGHAAGIAGNAIWLSFVVAAIIASFTAFSYAELSGMFSKEAAEFVYTKNAFRKRILAFIVEWIMLFTVTISAATVALGFGGYWSFLFGGKIAFIALILLAAMSAINYFGIKESAKYNDVSTIIEVIGLVGIIGLGVYYITKNDLFSSLNLLETPTGIYGIFAGTTLVYFAFIGFENLVNISEEAKHAKEIIPKAILISLAISAVIYVLVAIAAVSILGWEALSASKAPLAEAAEKVIPGSSGVLAVIALFATSNTVLILLIVGSRLLYGLSSNGSLPAFLSRIGERGTPYFSVLTILALSGLSLLLGGIKKLAHLTDLGIFIVYIFVNLSVIVLRYREPDAKRLFRSPLNIGRFPLMAFMGILLNLLMFYFFDFMTFVYGILLSAAGFVVYFLFDKNHQKDL